MCNSLYALIFLSTQSESKGNLSTGSESHILCPLPSGTFTISSLPHTVRYLLSFCHFTPLCCFMLTELELLLIFPLPGLPPPSIIVSASILMSMTNSKMISLQWLTPHDSFIFAIYSAYFCTLTMCKAVLQTGDAAVTSHRPVPNQMKSQFSCGTRRLTSKHEAKWWHSEHWHC